MNSWVTPLYINKGFFILSPLRISELMNIENHIIQKTVDILRMRLILLFVYLFYNFRLIYFYERVFD